MLESIFKKNKLVVVFCCFSLTFLLTQMFPEYKFLFFSGFIIFILLFLLATFLWKIGIVWRAESKYGSNKNDKSDEKQKSGRVRFSNFAFGKEKKIEKEHDSIHYHIDIIPDNVSLRFDDIEEKKRVISEKQKKESNQQKLPGYNQNQETIKRSSGYGYNSSDIILPITNPVNPINQTEIGKGVSSIVDGQQAIKNQQPDQQLPQQQKQFDDNKVTAVVAQQQPQETRHVASFHQIPLNIDPNQAVQQQRYNYALSMPIFDPQNIDPRSSGFLHFIVSSSGLQSPQVLANILTWAINNCPPEVFMKYFYNLGGGGIMVSPVVAGLFDKSSDSAVKTLHANNVSINNIKDHSDNTASFKSAEESLRSVLKNVQSSLGGRLTNEMQHQKQQNEHDDKSPSIIKTFAARPGVGIMPLNIAQLYQLLNALNNMHSNSSHESLPVFRR